MKNSTRYYHEQSIKIQMENQKLRKEIDLKKTEIEKCNNRINELVEMNLKILKSQRILLGM